MTSRGSAPAATRPNAVWAAALITPESRTAWAAAFNDPHMRNPRTAATARAWRNVTSHPGYAAYLHHHGHPIPTGEQVSIAFSDALDHLSLNETRPRAFTLAGNWAALTTHHPHLNPDDATLLVTAGLTPTEADHLIATGTLDRAILATMAALA